MFILRVCEGPAPIRCKIRRIGSKADLQQKKYGNVFLLWPRYYLDQALEHKQGRLGCVVPYNDRSREAFTVCRTALAFQENFVSAKEGKVNGARSMEKQRPMKELSGQSRLQLLFLSLCNDRKLVWQAIKLYYPTPLIYLSRKRKICVFGKSQSYNSKEPTIEALQVRKKSIISSTQIVLFKAPQLSWP